MCHHEPFNETNTLVIRWYRFTSGCYHRPVTLIETDADLLLHAMPSAQWPQISLSDTSTTIVQRHCQELVPVGKRSLSEQSGRYWSGFQRCSWLRSHLSANSR